MNDQTVEFSRPQQAERLPNQGKHVKLEATADERHALAKRFGLADLDHLVAEVHLTPFARGELVRLTGWLKAGVTQTCGVTLGPVQSVLDGTFELTYTFEAPAPTGREVEMDAEGEDPPEPIENGELDLGEIVAEQLALLIDPFPRAPGAQFTPPEDDATVVQGPFAALASLRDKRS